MTPPAPLDILQAPAPNDDEMVHVFAPGDRDHSPLFWAKLREVWYALRATCKDDDEGMVMVALALHLDEHLAFSEK